MSPGAVTLEVMGILVGQNLPLRLPNADTSHMLLTLWLLFALIMGLVYRGNLTAALTLPKYPPRPETIEQLVNTVDRITAPPIGKEWRKFMLASESEVYKKFGSLMLVGPTAPEGLLMATRQNTAQMTDRRNMAGLIAQHFTRADGSTPLYLGREPILPVPAAWPIPHDAPFKTHLDRYLRAIVESGLFEKWNEDTLMEIRRESQRRQLSLLDQQEERAGAGSDPGGSITALTLTHMQGPLMLLILSLSLAGISFIGEILAIGYHKSTWN
ncbi:ionotropic receptor 93a-like [Panulirus ornatus]|uniref:ionotropic receptor 93a-like n=1 Tax=Panulirus ornatus TaxID=150431 RepID=UPI003A8757C0